MKRVAFSRTIGRLLFVSLALCAASWGQSGVDFVPQVDTYIGLTPAINVMLLAGGSVGSARKNESVIFGPSVNIAVLPFISPHLKTLNPDKSRFLTLQLGYRYIKSIPGNGGGQNRGIVALTPRVPLPAKLQLADRNRVDLDGMPNQFTWLYRNRVTLARSFQIRSFILTPYSEVEVFYNCQTGQWTKYSYFFGSTFRVNTKMQLDPYFVRQNPIESSSNTFNGVGLRLELFFNTKGK
jgi:hypothetical protein